MEAGIFPEKPKKIIFRISLQKQNIFLKKNRFNNYDRYLHFLNELLPNILMIIPIIVVPGILELLIKELKKFLKSHDINFLMQYLNIISYFIFGLVVVVLSATVGPYTLEHFANYTISGPRTMTASDATNYTVQALVASVIVGFLSSLKDKNERGKN